MSPNPLSVLVISDLFPNPAKETHGAFVREQVKALAPYCSQIVTVPVRVFPGALLKSLHQPKKIRQTFSTWRQQTDEIPGYRVLDGIDIYYSRYTSLPRRGFRGSWGYSAYYSMSSLLRKLHAGRNFDLIHAHVASPAGIVALQAQAWMNIPVVVSVHGADVHYTMRQNRFSANMVRNVFRQADHIVANSHWTADEILKNGGTSDRLSIIHLGGDIEQGKIDAPIYRPTTAFNMLTVGRLAPGKGHTSVLDALSRLRNDGFDIGYTIVGEGPLHSTLEAQVQRLGLSDVVQFTGAVPHTLVSAYYEASDLFVMPSRVEGFGLVFIEALGVGIPAIGCAGTGGPQELAALGDCMTLVEPNDSAQLARAIASFYVNPERRRFMGENGRRIVAQHFTWENNAKATIKLYNRLIEAYDHKH